MSIEGAIFDLDGTLVNSEGLYNDATQEIISLYGNKKTYLNDNEIMKKVSGRPEKENSQLIVDNFDIKLSAEEFIIKRRVILKKLFETLLPMPGAKEIVTNLKNKNIKLAVATSSDKESYNDKTKNLQDWFKLFDIIITSEDKRVTKSKPNPDIFLLAANDLNINMDKCIIFEDSVNGVLAALNAKPKYVIATPVNEVIKDIEALNYDKEKTKLIILKSLEDFDYKLLQ